jgi:hypothetical protein
MSAIGISLSLSSCDYADGKLILSNTSSDTLFYSLNSVDTIQLDDYPIWWDNFFPYRHSMQRYEYAKKYDDSISTDSRWILPNSETRESVINTTWESRIGKYPDKSVKIFLFKKQILDSLDWEEIVKGQVYTKKLILSVPDLEKQNWKVTY